MKYRTLKPTLALLLGASMTLSPLLPAMTPVLAQEQTADPAQTDDLRALVSPVLQEYTRAVVDGTWTMSDSTMLAIGASQEQIDNQKLADMVRLISSEMKDKGLSADFVPVRYLPSDAADPNVIRIDLAESVTDASTSPEAYRITIGANGVHLTGASELAVLNGLHTIEALLVQGGLPYGTIVDYPTVAERRIHVDCARKYISKDWLIRLIHEMSWNKMNALQIHFSENLGFRIECETDPEIVSDQYLTKAEVREILAEARKYGISVIPSFDSPGHVDQILKAHPEYGQVSSSASHYASGLDITNPEAVEYIRSLYAEYCELFEGCTDFHIGGDEYMEFDRAPFTTQYQSVLNAYAVEKYGTGYTWKDAVSGYINELAEFVHEKGFTPRIWNDGIYYGHSSSSGRQKIEMHDYIGIDFWSQMGWNPSIAKLSAFIEMGHKKIYNINSSYFYYVLRGSKPTDGREQHSFDNLNPDQLIYNEWTPGKFSSNTIDDESDVIAGAAIGIWCDVPDLVEEDVIMEDILAPMQALASKSWNTSSNSILPFSDFQVVTQALGHGGAWTKGEKLPEAPAVLPSEDLGRLVVHFTDDQGNKIADDRTLYAAAGTAYTIEPDTIYGYQTEDAPVSGTYEEAGREITFVYQLHTDWSELDALLENEQSQTSVLPEGWPDYYSALEAAKTVRRHSSAFQREVDEAAAALRQAQEALVPVELYALSIECEHPLLEASIEQGWSGYESALHQARTLLNSGRPAREEIRQAIEALNTAKAALVFKTEQTPTVSGTLPPYMTYAYTNMYDDNLSTFTWFDGAQTVGATVTFTFDAPVILSAIRIQSPSDTADLDYIRAADVEITTDGTNWTKVGEFEGASRDSTISFDSQSATAIRLRLTQAVSNWYKITEVDFTIEAPATDSALIERLRQASLYNPDLYTWQSITPLIAALRDGQAALSSRKANAQEEIDAIDRTIRMLVEKNPMRLDRSQLYQAIEKGVALAYCENDYSAKTIEELLRQLAAANQASNTADTQEAINSAASALNAFLLTMRRLPSADALDF